MRRKNDWGRICLLAFLILAHAAVAVAQQKYSLSGTVYEVSEGRQRPLDFATISLPDYGLAATTAGGGRYTINNVPVGKVKVRVSFLGKAQLDRELNISGSMKNLDFVLQDEDFRLKEVVVTAQQSAAGRATSSNISRQAMDHMQATNLADLMALTPGGVSKNQDLNSAKTLNIRQVDGGRDTELNSLGTAIIQDGAPISNNANLSSLNPTVAGGAVSLAGGSSPNSGFDVRAISTENIENVEVVRGIPSVEYGDLTSGAVIIHTKAGREPLRIRAKANPNVYQGSVGGGFSLGKRGGSLNLSADYAYNIKNPTESYDHYQRLTAKVLYSNTFFGNKLRSNTSLDFFYGKDARDRNPDDEIELTSHRGQDVGLRFNTNGLWNIGRGWLENLRYVVSASYTAKDSYSETAYSSANAPYSMTMTDGAVLSNVAGEHLFTAGGTEITRFGEDDAGHYALYLPSSYLGRYDIDSREVNFYAKLTANFFKRFGRVNNRILLGVDFKTDGNEGDGKTYDSQRPPYRNLQQKNAAFRPRAYKDIPYINQLGAFVEDNFNWMIGGTHTLNLQAGLRFDHVSVAGSVLSPRLNASIDIVPEVLALRGGFGIAAKMPTLLYLYPENAYFEYINLNELANENLPEADRRFITTTRIFNSQNRDLKIARNYKSEVGLDLRLGKVRVGLTGFLERLKNGYALNKTLATFVPVSYDVYGRNAAGALELTGRYPVLSSYYTPTNNNFVNTKGVEFEIDVARIESIRTSFQLSGSWMRSSHYSEAYDFYDNTPEAPAARKDIAVYDKRKVDYYDQQFVTTLRATHNIPRIGFVVTLTAQAIWNQSDWGVYHNDSIPTGYIALADGRVNWFTPGQYTTTQQLREAGLDYLLDTSSSRSYSIKESFSPYFCFNINITKEIGDLLRMSFFANNMFRSHPRRESRRSPGEFYKLNNRFYFGMELALKI
ncbi:TonB-dependent receptor [Prevotella sp. KH2C16]|uniref:TonB-dependent receptor n=1 Tax=Prevotella sp. KH2C16 TaxID=1855325 RepID=UPI0008EF9A7A|nr:TonB-dependent receptor [Prevotella sp. KH2C16]SFG17261.1 CarboxypepD_reg-like domain-containing protein [Prevotella sp. KH2C16]